MHPINFNILDFIIKDYEYNFRLTPKGYLILGLGLEPSSIKCGFYFPKNLIERFDGDTVYFKITKDESKEYKRDY